MSEDVNDNTAPCYLCGKRVDADDNYCYGCCEVICDSHLGDSAYGNHEPEAHDEDEDELDD